MLTSQSGAVTGGHCEDKGFDARKVTSPRCDVREDKMTSQMLSGPRRRLRLSVVVSLMPVISATMI